MQIVPISHHFLNREINFVRNDYFDQIHNVPRKAKGERLLPRWGLFVPQINGERGNDLSQVPGQDLPSDSRGAGPNFDPTKGP